MVWGLCKVWEYVRLKRTSGSGGCRVGRKSGLGEHPVQEDVWLQSMLGSGGWGILDWVYGMRKKDEGYGMRGV